MKGSKEVKKKKMRGRWDEKNRENLIIKEEQIGEKSPSWPASKKEYFCHLLHFFITLVLVLV